MQAVRLVDGKLTIADVPVPEPGPGDALVRIDAAGVCHSDLHVARGDWSASRLRRARPRGHRHRRRARRRSRRVRAGRRSCVLGLGGGGGGFWCGACRDCLAGDRGCAPGGQADRGHVRRVLHRVGEVVGDDPRRRRQRGSITRVRRAHRVRRGEEAARPPRASPADRSPSSAPPVGSATTRCSSPTRSATASSASTWARSDSTS